ncbi:unnamed protein product [Gongylonema pulchrum]|uniref:MAM domain-containing protein n=1 Tax=Gongylonema pulchrum TaxID=637853 RepID=A0A183D608_9BILA|nr:unnamed protein product [Gongylonema pulchrum]
MDVDRNQPFFVQLVGKSTGSGFVLLRQIETSGDWCPLPTVSQYACKKLSCTFQQSFCNYMTDTSQQANILFTLNTKG